MAGVGEINQAIIDRITNFNLLDFLTWIFIGILIVGAVLYFFIWWKNKKLFNKVVEVREINGDHFQKTYTDLAKNVKRGKGGFVILYLKKLKTWKLAYGGRTGKNIYEFFIMPDGYWYNGVISTDIGYVDKNKGLMKVITTNPLMRAGYSSLEKQIDDLTGNKVSFWDKYGNWVLSVSFVLIAGFMLWMIAKQVGDVTGALSGLVNKMDSLLAQINNLLQNSEIINNKDTGLVPALLLMRRKR